MSFGTSLSYIINITVSTQQNEEGCNYTARNEVCMLVVLLLTSIVFFMEGKSKQIFL